MVHPIQHVSFDGPGVIAGWAESRGLELNVTKLYSGQEDLLIVMAGPAPHL